MFNSSIVLLNLKQSSFIVLLISLFLLTLPVEVVQAQPFAYVVNQNSNTVSVIDIATNVVVEMMNTVRVRIYPDRSEGVSSTQDRVFIASGQVLTAT